jgi:hypothetical protein
MEAPMLEQLPKVPPFFKACWAAHRASIPTVLSRHLSVSCSPELKFSDVASGQPRVATHALPTAAGTGNRQNRRFAGRIQPMSERILGKVCRRLAATGKFSLYRCHGFQVTWICGKPYCAGF